MSAFSPVEISEKSARIKVIGVGGAGGNAVNNMIESNLVGVQFIVANTDAQALDTSKAPGKIQIGGKLTEGLGAGANPNVGKEAAEEDVETLREALKDSHMVFITAGLGGGTGTGAAPIIAQVCKELGALTVGVVTKPFKFEGKKRSQQAEDGLYALKNVADTVITIQNDKLREIAGKNTTMIEMFKKADEVLHHSVKGITDLIMKPGLINLDFADVKSTMDKAGMAIMGIGAAQGEDRAKIAAEKAMTHPLLEDISINGCRALLMNITASSEMTLDEMTEASEIISEAAGEKAEIIWGTAIDDSMGDEMSITLIATGIGGGEQKAVGQRRAKNLSYINKVRDLPQDQYDVSIDLEEPTYIRNKRAVNESFSGGGFTTSRRNMALDGYGGRNDLDVPTFLRKKAD